MVFPWFFHGFSKFTLCFSRTSQLAPWIPLDSPGQVSKEPKPDADSASDAEVSTEAPETEAPAEAETTEEVNVEPKGEGAADWACWGCWVKMVELAILESGDELYEKSMNNHMVVL